MIMRANMISASYGVLDAQIRHRTGHRARCMVRHDTGATFAQVSLLSHSLSDARPPFEECPPLHAALAVLPTGLGRLATHRTRVGAFASVPNFRTDQDHKPH